MIELTPEKILELVQQYGLPIVWAVLILIVGSMAAKIITRIACSVLRKAEVDKTLVKFTKNIVYAILMLFVLLAALSKLGIETTSMAAVIAAGGLAIGMSLQGSLGNFASGVMLIIFRPFKVGDFVEAGGVSGSVEEIKIFNTQLCTPDNKRIIVPNGEITSASITNYSANATRRVDMVIGVGYEDDLKQVKAVLHDVLSKESRLLEEPKPTVGLLELGDNSVNFAVRPWVKTSDYWPVLFDLQEAIKLRFDEEGISIPYPQRDVHIINQSS